MFEQYLIEKEKARKEAQSLIGKKINYTWSGNPVNGLVEGVHQSSDKIYVKSMTGKSYYISWAMFNCVIEDD